MIKFFFSLILIVILGTSAWLYSLYNELSYSIDKITNYKPKLTTKFYDRNGKLIANIFQDENREYVKYDDIPARVVEGLVAIEDTQYFEHFGINPDAISRAVIKDIKAGAFVEGASTLTQQLVKMLVLSREKKLIRKIKEALIAIKIETLLTKEEILERYLNNVYFGHGYYGIKTAAKGYFDKELYELSLKEISILVGLPRAPSFYDPTRNLKISLARSNQVINRMHTLGWINDEQYEDALKEIPIIHNKTLTQNKAPYIVDYALKTLKKDFPDISYGGYKIFLTVDLDAQNIAKKAVKLIYKKALERDMYFRKKENDLDNNSYINTLNTALISIENNTGKILSMVGGVDYKKSMFNRVTQAKRQTGSAIKPFLYLIGLNQGLNPATQLADISRTFIYKSNGEEKKWQPKNYAGKFKGLISLRNSLVYSRNLSTLNLVTNVGLNTAYNGLKSFGFTNVPKDLSITLGSSSVSPIEFSKMYSIFSNNGTKVNPYIIERIKTNNNEIIDFKPHLEHTQAPEQAFLLTTILRDVVKRGTGRRARVKGIELAGKTGTTNDNMDAWFCGFSPSIQTIIWVGNDNNKPMRRTEGGGITAAPGFKYFYENYLKIHPEIPRHFKKPENIFETVLNNKKEYYTKTSPLPEVQMNSTPENKNNNFIEF